MMVGESNEPWLGKVPSKWTIRRIKDIAELKCGDGITSESITPVGDFPVFGGNGLRGYTTSFTHDGHYVLIGRQGALCGNINYAKGKFWASEHAVVASMIGKIDTYWLGELLRDMNLNQYSNAAAQPGLAVDRIKFLRIPVPPLEEQQRIAAYLDASCAAIDAAVAAKHRQLGTLDALACSIINRAVTRGCEEHASLRPTGVVWFPEVPAKWRVARFKSMFRLIYRYPTYFNIEYVPEGITEVRGEALTPDGFIDCLPDERYISPETAAQFPKTQLELGDIVMSVRGTMGKIGLVNAKYVGTNITANLLRLSPDNRRVTGEFLRWLMRSTYFNEALNSSAPQTTIKTITMPQLAKLRVALPPKPEQHQICIFLEKKIADVKRIVSGIETQIATLIAYRKSLIHECVTGQRRISDVDVNRAKAAR